MLTTLDDTLWHQLPTTFDHVGTSDPRFFDRYWFAFYAPDGSAAAQVTMGAYRNMNVLDGAAVVVTGGRQHNLRVSRSFGIDMTTRCGPLSIDVVQPLQEFQLKIDSGSHLFGDIRWTGIALPHQENPHFKRVRGRAAEDYQRFDQIGLVSGVLEVGGKKINIDRWWACRDHSWGVRPGIGIREPVTGESPPLDERGFTMAFLFFSTDTIAGTLLLSGREGEERYTNGMIRDLASGKETVVTTVALDVSLHESTRRFKTATLTATLETGEQLVLRNEAIGSAIAMQGLGYSGGYNDRRGLGVWRGDSHIETDVWDVSAPATIVYEDGSSKDHWHRIQPVAVTATLDGKAPSRGTGSMTLILSGSIPSLGL